MTMERLAESGRQKQAGRRQKVPNIYKEQKTTNTQDKSSKDNLAYKDLAN